jgi:hypothetical protein
MPEHNPMQSLLRRHLGMDAFALDGDDTELAESWQDRPRRPKGVDVEITERRA